ncbi:bifunctional lysylphosphatidylglycerol synthetase/lysine--tRNA ligase LysX [Saccharopolyspora sp. SCSIO 74807]|uniref:bifunctional lysylphosphatidylglycerol synthetase/lysine--tRNA ligase LysX n=1 Tax=Saccharopolyspora sp. SCSIO 74807 TaxID=3118084 RepID=UPI0030D3F796
MVREAVAPAADPRDADAVRSSSGWHARVPRAAAGALLLIALLSVASAVGLAVTGGIQPVRRIVDDFVFPAPPNLAYAAFLVVLAAALERRKHVAYRLLLLILVLQTLADALVVFLWSTDQELLAEEVGRYRAPEWGGWVFAVNLAVSVAVFAALLLARDEFYGRTKRGGVRQGLSVFALLVTTSVGLGFVLAWLAPGSLENPWEWLTWTAERVLGGAVTFDIARDGHAPAWVNLLLGLFGAAALFTALLLMLRAQRVASALSEDDERRIRTLLAESGERDSLGYFATRRDKAALFSPSGKAAITYREVAGVCLASGDPLGEPEAWRPAIDRWLAMCREYTWVPAVLGVSEAGAAAYARAGLKILQLGDEAILHTAEFNLDGRDMRPVRQAVNRVRRAGYTARIRRHSDVPQREMAEAMRLAREWRHTDTERGFSMALGRLGDPADGECVLVEALDADQRPVGLLSLTPWGRHGLSLDLMRREGGSDNGVVELMVCSLMQQAWWFAVERVSLNFAVFRSAFDEGARLGAGPVLQAWRGLLLFFSRWWQLESLYRANVKYQPRWSPRFVGFCERRELARIGVASVIAEGFLSVPGAAPVAAPEEPSGEHRRVPALSEPRPDSGDVPEQSRMRLDKADDLRARGIDPYPAGITRAESCRSLLDRHGGLAADSTTGDRTSLAGRVMLLRDHGGVCFASLRDFSGDVQVMLTASGSGDALRTWREQVDIGDQVSVTGDVVASAHGEVSLLATEWTMAGKCLHPLPSKHRGLTDQDARVRQRYLDLVMRPQAREALHARSATLHAVRGALIGDGFLEVETPVLQPVHGGANARPFSTRSNAYDMPLYLRIAPELYLKRLCVGGVDKLFEIGRVFRNEGVSYRHNPEFTVLEAYAAFADYGTVRELCRRLVQAAAEAVNGAQIARRDGDVDLSGEWPVITVNEAISKALGEEITIGTPLEDLHRACAAAGVPHDPEWDRGTVVHEVYERLVEPSTQEPTFYTDFPAEVAPLARPHRADPRLAERWDLVAFGVELGTGYSELTDPVEQRRRLTEQSRLAAGGDAEAMELDEDFLTALEYAMPPTGGLGLGIDRLIMLLTGRSIRDTLAFPLAKPVGS